MNTGNPTAAPPFFPYATHRTMEQVISDDRREQMWEMAAAINASRLARENARRRDFKRERRAAGKC